MPISRLLKLKRPIEPMPEFVQAALEKENLLGDYESRPAYQRNDYLLWINSAKRQETKEKRLHFLSVFVNPGEFHKALFIQSFLIF